MNKRRLLLILIIGLVPLAAGWFSSTEYWEDITIAYVNGVDVQATGADSADEAGTVKLPATVTADFGPSPTYAIDIEEVRLQYSTTKGLSEEWVDTYDDGSNEDGHAVATDSSNNIIAVGYHWTGSVNEGYIIKYNSSGGIEWQKTPSNSTYGFGVATDESDNIIFGGEYTHDYRIIKYDSAGNSQWDKVLTATNESGIRSVAVDSSDDILVTGSEKGDDGDYDYYTIKYNSSGTKQWEQTYDSGGNDYANSVATDSSNNVIVTGQSSASGSGYYTIKYDSTGTEQWTESYDGEVANAVATDSSDNIIVAGSIIGQDSDKDWYIIKYDSAGTEQWNKTYNSGNGGDEANGVATDSSDNIIVTGTNASGNYYTIKYDSSGTEISNVSYDSWADISHSVAIDSSDNVAVTGTVYNGDDDDFVTIKYGGFYTNWTTLTEYTNTISGSWASGPKQQLLGQYQLTEDNVGLGTDVLVRLQVQNPTEGYENADTGVDTGAEGDNGWQDQWVTSFTTDTNKRPELTAESLDR